MDDFETVDFLTDRHGVDVQPEDEKNITDLYVSFSACCGETDKQIDGSNRIRKRHPAQQDGHHACRDGRSNRDDRQDPQPVSISKLT
jgi:hypothetical protein